MTEVTVIGGGVIGTSVAFRLARAGVSVSLLEAGRLASGTSGATTGWANASRKPVHEYFLLAASGMAEHRRLRQELGEAPWLHENGNLEWAEDDAGRRKLDERVARLRAWGYAAEWLTRADVAALEPDLVLPDGVERAVHYPAEGHVDTPVLIGRLAEEARRAGATIRTECRVAAVETRAGKVAGVRLADGGRVAADAVVSCAGPWTGELLRTAGLECPMASSPGLIAVSTPTPVVLRGNVHTPLLSLQPDGAGRVMMRGEKWDGGIDATTPAQPPPAVCRDILAATLAVLPGMAGAEVESARIGVRPNPADKRPLIGAIPVVDGLFVAVMHSAVTMGPFVGRLLAEEIVAGVVDPRLTKFRPERLITAA